MVRRSFRMGLRLGLLFGVGFALFKTMQSRRSSSDPGPVPEPGAWEPLRSDAAEQPPTSVTSVVEPPARPSTGAGSSPANVRPSAPPRPPADGAALRMPDLPTRSESATPATPPSAASEGRAATSTPATPPPVVDEVGEPILEPAPPIEPAPSPRPRRTRNRPTAGAAPDPSLDVVPEDDIVPARPVRKAAAKKAAAKKAPAKKAAKATKAAKKAAPITGWVEAQEGTCPPTHPVKAKLASKLFHLPGMLAYTRTRPDRCYLDADAAVADGFTAAKR